MSPTPPEQYHVHAPTSHVPNSRLPVLIYRSALPGSTGSDLATAATPAAAAAAARDLIERNHWFYGGTFKTYWRHHFHSVTHECYAVVRGQSRMLLGVGPLDCEVEDDEDEGREEEGGKGEAERKGVEVVVGEGDVIVLPVSVHTISSCVLEFDRIGRPIFVGFGRGWEVREKNVGGNRDKKVRLFDGHLLTKKRQAGVSHCSITSGREYEYLGLYPEVRRRVFKRLVSCKNLFYHADSLWHSRGVRSTTTISAKLGKTRQG
jgi:uncharacterized protein YjlB